MQCLDPRERDFSKLIPVFSSFLRGRSPQSDKRPELNLLLIFIYIVTLGFGQQFLCVLLKRSFATVQFSYFPKGSVDRSAVNYMMASILGSELEKDLSCYQVK